MCFIVCCGDSGSDHSSSHDDGSTPDIVQEIERCVDELDDDDLFPDHDSDD